MPSRKELARIEMLPDKQERIKARNMITKLSFPLKSRYKNKCMAAVKNIPYRDTILLKKIYECILSCKNGEEYKIPTLKETAKVNPFDKVVYEDEIELQLDKGTGNTHALFGSSKSGKSTLISHIYEKYYDHDEICSTLFTDSPQNKILIGKPDLAICNNFGKSACKMINAQKYFNTKNNNKYEFLAILDDIVDISYNKIVNKMILIYRNSLISSIISLQYCKLLSKKARGNVNNVIMLSLNTDEAIEQCIKLFLKSYFRKMGCLCMTEMIDLYREITKDHGMVYIRPSEPDFIKFIRLDLNKKIDPIYPDGYSERLEKRCEKEEKALKSAPNSESVNELLSYATNTGYKGKIDREFIVKNKPDLNVMREYFNVQLESINKDAEKGIFI